MSGSREGPRASRPNGASRERNQGKSEDGRRGRPFTRETLQLPPCRSKQPPGRALARTVLGPMGDGLLASTPCVAEDLALQPDVLGGSGAPLLTWATRAAPRQTGLGQPIARSLSMACPRLEPSTPSPGDGDAAGSILARSHVLVASSNKLMPSIQLRVSRRRTVLAFRRDCMSSAASPYRVERVGDITLAPQG